MSNIDHHKIKIAWVSHARFKFIVKPYTFQTEYSYACHHLLISIDKKNIFSHIKPLPSLKITVPGQHNNSYYVCTRQYEN